MLKNLPFNRGIFWKVLPAVYVLVIVGWMVVVRFAEYEMASADYGGSFISSTILAYLVHLWLLPGEFEEDDIEDEDRRAG